MNKQIKRFCVTVIMIIIMVCVCNQVSFAIIAANWRECLVAPGCSCTLTLDIAKSTATTMKTYIIKSAGYFFDSHTNYQAFLNRVEMAEINGVNYKELRAILYSAIDHMEKAKAAYENVKIVAAKTSYHQEMIDKLMIFDYEGFRVQYGLNEPIFEKVKSLLIIGDIPGLDDTVISNMDAILKQLYTAKAFVDKDSAPDVSILWRITQSYFEAQLFNQYMSEVFRDILY